MNQPTSLSLDRDNAESAGSGHHGSSCEAARPIGSTEISPFSPFSPIYNTSAAVATTSSAVVRVHTGLTVGNLEPTNCKSSSGMEILRFTAADPV